MTADFLDDPVPTTSPTKTKFEPSCLNEFSSARGSAIFSENFKNACACKGISGLDHASLAGEKSSVLVSPLTLKILSSISFAKSGFLVNHSASAHELMTSFANSFSEDMS